MNNKVLYHGTTQEYLDMMTDEDGNYKPFSKCIDMAHAPFSCTGYAVDRSRKYDATPILLGINPLKINATYSRMGITAKEISKAAYKIVNVTIGENGYIDSKTVEEIVNLETIISKEIANCN